MAHYSLLIVNQKSNLGGNNLGLGNFWTTRDVYFQTADLKFRLLPTVCFL